MTKICKKCGYYIDIVPKTGAWIDEYEDDACYDEETLSMQGYHEPKD